MKKEEPVFGSFAWDALQLARAVEVEKHLLDIEDRVPKICPLCEKRPRVYSNGRLYSYCGVCRKAVNKARYNLVKKNVK